MFTLIEENRPFYRIKRGQSAKEVSDRLCVPVKGESFGGRIIDCGKTYIIYRARPGDSFLSVSEKFGVNETDLEKLNGGVVFPSRKIYIPRDGVKHSDG